MGKKKFDIFEIPHEVYSNAIRLFEDVSCIIDGEDPTAQILALSIAISELMYENNFSLNKFKGFFEDLHEEFNDRRSK